MLKFIGKIFNDCAQNHENKYDFMKVGAIIGCNCIILLSGILIYQKQPINLLTFAEAYTMLLGGAGVGVGFKNKMEK